MQLFTAEWCGPCKELKRWLKAKGHKIGTFDVETSVIGQEAVAARKVQQLPCLIDDEGNAHIGREEIKPYIEALLK